MTDPAACFKQQAGELAAGLVESGMMVGLGTGSTAIFSMRRVAERLHAGEISGIVAIATSRATAEAARALGIPLLADDIPRVGGAIGVRHLRSSAVDHGENAWPVHAEGTE